MTVSRVLILLLVAGLSVLLAAQSDKSQSKEAEPKKPNPNRITMTVKAKTGSRNRNAKSNPKIYVLINGDEKHKAHLDDPKRNDFELGATDTFKNLAVNVPLEKIEKIRIQAENNDLWHCESISVQFFQKKLQSREYKFPCNRYLSAGKENKAFNATPFVDFKIARKPELAPPEKEKPKEDKPG